MNDRYSTPYPAAVMTREEFGAALQWLRRRHAAINGRPELSLREIAARTRGCVHNTIRNYLAGSTLPSPQALQRLLTIFEAPAEQRDFLLRARDELAASAPVTPGRRTVAVSTLTGMAGWTGTGALLNTGMKYPGGE
jgi:hypothetical protein